MAVFVCISVRIDALRTATDLTVLATEEKLVQNGQSVEFLN